MNKNSDISIKGENFIVKGLNPLLIDIEEYIKLMEYMKLDSSALIDYYTILKSNVSAEEKLIIAKKAQFFMGGFLNESKNIRE
ncbi:MAG: hypothetical protein ACRC28_02700 [Clostridium sp.]|uniref:hypothetical protein n=1 Tax=Clostridium sp. TaxID=1506 RepID=UPI003F3F87C1